MILAIAAHVVSACDAWNDDILAASPWGTAEIWGTPHGWVVDVSIHKIVLRPEELRPPRQDLDLASL